MVEVFLRVVFDMVSSLSCYGSLKVGGVYGAKRKVTILIDLNNDENFYLNKGSMFVVIKDLTDEEERDDYHEYHILYEGKKYSLCIKVRDWKAVGYDFELINKK